jgi:hypothetical protein
LAVRGLRTAPRALAGRLRRARAFLRILGIEITFSREGRVGTRIIRIHRTLENTVGTVSNDGRRVTTTLSATSP